MNNNKGLINDKINFQLQNASIKIDTNDKILYLKKTKN